MEFPQLPTAFGLTLEENEVALNAFNSLAEAQRLAIIARARDAHTPEEMHKIISTLTQGCVP